MKLSFLQIRSLSEASTQLLGFTRTSKPSVVLLDCSGRDLGKGFRWFLSLPLCRTPAACPKAKSASFFSFVVWQTRCQGSLSSSGFEPRHFLHQAKTCAVLAQRVGGAAFSRRGGGSLRGQPPHFSHIFGLRASIVIALTALN